MQRSKEYVAVPFCLLAQGVRAETIVRRYPAVVKPVVDFLSSNDFNIIQMPCPELVFDGFHRKPCKKDNYDKPENRKICKKISKQIVASFQTLQNNGHHVRAVVGIEYSPSCAISILGGRPPAKQVKGSGIFIEELKKSLSQAQLSPHLIGVQVYNISRTITEMHNKLIIKGGPKMLLSDSEIEKYTKWLSSLDENHRDTAISVLHHTGIRNPNIDKQLIRLFSTERSDKVRRAVADFTAQCEDKQFVPILLQGLNDQDWMVRGKSFIGLRKIDIQFLNSPEVKAYIQSEMHPYGIYCIRKYSK